MTTKEAIQLLKSATMFEPTLENRDYPEAFDLAIKALEERPQGEWIFRSGVTCGGYYKCSNCGEVERAEKNYCPNCGALMMKGGKEE